MKKIKFGEFELVSLFKTIARGTRLTTTNRVIGEIPLITAGKDNFGISQHISNGETLFSGVNLTIDMFGNSFVRDYMYYADDNIISLSGNMSVGSLLYIKSQLEWLTKAYSYANQFRINSLEDLSVRLPINDEGAPDWVYMEEYIESIKKKFIESKIEYKNNLKEKLESLLENKQKYELEDVEFGEFRMDESLSISSAKKPIHKNMIKDFNGEIPYVTRTESRNGVSNMINFSENVSEHINSGNVITLAMDTYAAFYQESEFFNGNKIKIGVPKCDSHTENICLFLTSSINKMFANMSWGMGINSKGLNSLVINLPKTDQSHINWDYMDKYIHNIKIDKVNTIISELESEIEDLSRL